MAHDDADAPLGSADWLGLARPSVGALAQRLALRSWEPIALRLSRAGPMPDRLRFIPADPRRGRKEDGFAIVSGTFRWHGAELDTAGAQPFGLRMPSPRFRAWLHRFGWLADLCAVAAQAQNAATAAEAARTARRLTDGWIEGNSAYDENIWSAETAARRLLAWLAAAPLLTEGSDTIWKSRLYRSLAIHTRYLTQIAPRVPAGPQRSAALTASVVAMLALGDKSANLPRLTAALGPAFADQLLPDGGHVSRSPGALLAFVCDLIMLRDAFGECGQAMPKALLDALDAALPMVRFFQIGPGRLTAFHGGGGDAGDLIEAVLGVEPANDRPFGHAPHSAYHRLDAGATRVIVDAGALPPLSAAAEGHASCAAFEMSSNGQPIVINCGPAPGIDPMEDRVARATAAHSTVSIGPGSSAHVLNGSLAGRVLGPRIVGGPASIACQRHDENAAGYGGSWLDIAHDGYVRSAQARHVRRLYLQERGLDFRGEDRIESVDPGSPGHAVPFVVRFHIDPAVQVTPRNGESGASLRLPSGEVWHFQCRGGEVRIEDSARYGPAGAEPSVQISVHGTMDAGPASVKWAFQRDRGPGGPGSDGDDEA